MSSSNFSICDLCASSVATHRMAAHRLLCTTAVQNSAGAVSSVNAASLYTDNDVQPLPMPSESKASKTDAASAFVPFNPFVEGLAPTSSSSAAEPSTTSTNASKPKTSSTTSNGAARKGTGGAAPLMALCPYCGDKVNARQLGEHARTCWANPAGLDSSSSPFANTSSTSAKPTSPVAQTLAESKQRKSSVGKIELTSSTKAETSATATSTTTTSSTGAKNHANNANADPLNLFDGLNLSESGAATADATSTSTNANGGGSSKKKKLKKRGSKASIPDDDGDDDADEAGHDRVVYSQLPDMKHDPRFGGNGTLSSLDAPIAAAKSSAARSSAVNGSATSGGESAQPPPGLDDLELAMWLSKQEMNGGASAASPSSAPRDVPNSPKMVSEEMVPCVMCAKPFGLAHVSFLDACSHVYCAACLRRYVMSMVAKHKVSAIQCQAGDCTAKLAEFEVRMLLTDSEFEKYGQASVMELVEADKDTFVQCVNPKCTNVIERLNKNSENDASSPDKEGKSVKKRLQGKLSTLRASKGSNSKRDSGSAQRETDNEGRALSDEAIAHRDTHRFRCRECSTEFCAQCSATPYHLGHTCEQFAEFKEARHCRFCDQQLNKVTKTKHAAFADVCKDNECQAKMKAACTRMLACGHTCGGIRDEKECLPCLREPCCLQERKGVTQQGDEFCAICYVEDLNAAPAIQLQCGHIFHQECVQKKVGSGWPSSRITFTFMECPVCKQFVGHASLEKQLRPHVQLYEQVRQEALDRLRKMRQTKVKEITDSSSPYYNRPDVYAMQRFCYYPCFKCKKPYFGGEKACGAPVNAEEFDPKDLVCAGCTAGKASCKKHGSRYIEYKCKFCCKTACWFCWGNTHFCDDCHKIAPKIAKKPRSQLPKCTCGIPHPRNGEEYWTKPLRKQQRV